MSGERNECPDSPMSGERNECPDSPDSPDSPRTRTAVVIVRVILRATLAVFFILCGGGCGTQDLRKTTGAGRIDVLTSKGAVWVTRDFFGSSELPGAIFAFAFLEDGRIEQWLVDEKEKGLLVYEGKFSVSESGTVLLISVVEEMGDGHFINLLIKNASNSKVVTEHIGQNKEPSRRLTFTVRNSSDFDGYHREKY